MEESTALFILHKIANDFVLVMTEQAKTLPEADGKDATLLSFYSGISGRRNIVLRVRNLSSWFGLDEPDGSFTSL